MAATLGELAVLLTANNALFNKSIEDSKSTLGRLESAAQKAGLAAAAVFVAGAAVSGKLIDAASDAAEQMNVLDIAFGDNKDSIVEWSGATSQAIGRSATDLKDYAGQIGALISPTLGVSKATADMSTDLAELAIDLGSVFNAAENETLTALKAALIGSAEPMQRFGVNMNVAALEAFRLEKGMAKSITKMSEAEKIALRYAFVMEKTAAFQGDAEKTAAGWANMTKRVSGQITDLTAEIGAGLLPVAEDLISTVSGVLAEFQALSPETKAFIGYAIGAATAVAGVTAAALALGLALPTLIAGLPMVGIALGSIVLVANILLPIIQILRSDWINTLADMLDAVDTWVKDVMESIGWLGRALSAVVLPGVGGLAGLSAMIEQASTAVTGLARLGGGPDGPRETPLVSIDMSLVPLALEKIPKVINDLVLPALEKLPKTINTSLIPALEAIPDAVNDLALEAIPERAGLMDPFAPGPRAEDVLIDPFEGAAELPEPTVNGVPLTDFWGSVGDTAEGVLTQIGDLGGLISTGMQAFQAGGPYAAAIAVFADLAMQTEAFGDIIDDVNATVGTVIDAIEPLIVALQGVVSTILTSLAPVVKTLSGIIEALVVNAIGPWFTAIGALVAAIAPILEILMLVLSPVLEVLGVAMRVFAIIAGAVAVAIGWVVNAVIDVITEILTIIADIGSAFGDTSDIREFAQTIRASRINMEDLTDALEAAATGTTVVRAPLPVAETPGERAAAQAALLAATTPWAAAAAAAAERQAEMAAAWGATQTATSDAVGGLGDAADDTAESFREVSASLANIPEGFRIAAERFGAISVGDGGAAGLSAGGNTIIFQANDALEIHEKLKELDREDQVFGGLSPSDDKPNAVDRMGS